MDNFEKGDKNVHKSLGDRKKKKKKRRAWKDCIAPVGHLSNLAKDSKALKSFLRLMLGEELEVGAK